MFKKWNTFATQSLQNEMNQFVELKLEIFWQDEV